MPPTTILGGTNIIPKDLFIGITRDIYLIPEEFAPGGQVCNVAPRLVRTTSNGWYQDRKT
jgi:hypothetical protein